MVETRSKFFCVLCGRTQKEVIYLIHGKHVISHTDIFLCDICLNHSVDIISKNTKKKTPKVDGEFWRKLSPKYFNDCLNEYVEGQEDAKVILSVVMYEHCLRIMEGKLKGDKKKKNEIKPSNHCFLVGPSGSGKTYTIKTLVSTIPSDVPCVVVDATSYTEAGYAGEDTSNIWTELIKAAGGDLEKAKYGVIVVDEADKNQATEGTQRDISGKGVQQAFLKMLEGGNIYVDLNSNKKNVPPDFVQFDTSNILFIFCGAFEGLEKIVQRRVASDSYGFSNSSSMILPFENNEKSQYHIIKQSIPEDFIKFGIIRELVGRFSQFVFFEELTDKQMLDVLCHKKESLIKYYTQKFAQDNVKLVFTKEALLTIVSYARIQKTGVRSLKNVLFKVLVDAIYKYFGRKNGELIEYVVTKDLVDSRMINVLDSTNEILKVVNKA